MSNLIDKIRFEVSPPVEINPDQASFYYDIELYFSEHHVGGIRLIVGKKYKPFYVGITATRKTNFANYLSIDYKDIRKLATKFIMNGGLGFEVNKVNAIDWTYTQPTSD